MTVSGIAFLIMAVAFCVLVAMLIPTIKSIRKTADSVGELSDMVNAELKPALRELTVVLAELKSVGGGVAERTDDVKRFLSALGDTGNNLSAINRSVGVVTGLLSGSSVLVTGAKATGKYLIDRYIKQRGGK